MSSVDYRLTQHPAWSARQRQIDEVAAALHRMNKDPSLAENPLWQDLCAHFDRVCGNRSGWELPF